MNFALVEKIANAVLYEGYIDNHRAQLDRLHTHDCLKIPRQFDFRRLCGLSTEMADRFERAQPLTFGDARRVKGITTAGLTALLVSLTCQGKPASFT